MSSKDSTIQEFMDNIGAVFEVMDIEEIHCLLSSRINRNKEGPMTLNQNANATELLKTGIINAKEASTPLHPGMRYVPASKNKMLSVERVLK